MNKPLPPEQHIPHVRIPAALIADPARFGGVMADGYLAGDLILRAGRVAGLAPASADHPPRLVVPRLTEPHVHLDKCHTVDRLPSVGGNLRAAIEAQWRDKVRWTEEDLRERAERGLGELVAAGCGALRSHVDWGHGPEASQPPLAWNVLGDIAAEQRERITLQRAALASLEDLAAPETGPAIAGHVARAKGALGVFVHDHAQRKEGISAAFRLAADHGLPLDFHVDEGLAPGLDGLRLIARTMIDMRFDGPVLCGHACSLMNQTGDALKDTLDLVAEAGLSVCALPSTNLYLQGRGAGTPDRRGLTRIRELQAAGVPVVAGTDNVRDAFCPLGRHDPRAALSLAVLAGHLDPPLARLWPMITTDAQQAIGLAPTFVDDAGAHDLLICDAPTTSEALTGAAPLVPLLQGAMT